MNRYTQANGENTNGLVNSNSTTIRRTLIEHGLRQTNNDDNSPNDSLSAITTITKQHQDDQRELQELNTKLSSYLSHVHDLETYNGQLLAELDELTEKWGLDSNKTNTELTPKLKTLRNDLDNSLRDQIYQELRIKQYEYDILQTQQRIDNLINDTPNRLNELQEVLDDTNADLEHLKTEYDRRSKDLIKNRSYVENLGNEFDGLQTELLNHRLERILVENELQTVRESIAFQNIIYQTQREEILTLSKPTINSSKFYRNELVRAIADIRKDFEILSQNQNKELEEYYRIKTEEIKEEIVKDDERKRLLAEETRESTYDELTYSELVEELKELKLENKQLINDVNDLSSDLERIRGEQSRESEKYNLEIDQFQQELENKQNIINTIVKNNVSLRFELMTYRNLLNAEEKRLNQMEEQQQQQVQISSNQTLLNTDRRPTDYKIQKMAVKKSSKG